MNILDKLSDNEKQKLKIKKLQKNEVLFHENDRCRYIGIIEKGSVKIVSYLDNGQEIVYNILKKDGIFGNNLIFSSKPAYKGDVIALEESLIVLLDKENLLSMLAKNQDFLEEYLRISSDFSKTLNDKIKLISIASAQDRFIYYMHMHKNVITYLSVSELAKEMQLQRETLSRTLSKLEKEKVIVRNKNVIKLKAGI